MPYKNREDALAYGRKFRKENPQLCKDMIKDWEKRNPEKVKAKSDRYRAQHLEERAIAVDKWRIENPEKEEEYFVVLKTLVFSAYGPNGECKCSWEGCVVCDLDMLSLDHINNDGAEERRNGRGSGRGLYTKLKKAGFPEGFQTLCQNHQWKKENVRRREQRRNSLAAKSLDSSDSSVMVSEST